MGNESVLSSAQSDKEEGKAESATQGPHAEKEQQDPQSPAADQPVATSGA